MKLKPALGAFYETDQAYSTAPRACIGQWV